MRLSITSFGFSLNLSFSSHFPSFWRSNYNSIDNSTRPIGHFCWLFTRSEMNVVCRVWTVLIFFIIFSFFLFENDSSSEPLIFIEISEMSSRCSNTNNFEISEHLNFSACSILLEFSQFCQLISFSSWYHVPFWPQIPVWIESYALCRLQKRCSFLLLMERRHNIATILHIYFLQ